MISPPNGANISSDMPAEELVSEVKEIVAVAKGGDADGANARWSALFASEPFAAYPPEDQRQVLKFVILAKRSGMPPASLLAVHQSAKAPLEKLVAAFQEPVDYELLGLCHLILEENMAASAIFRTALEVERGRNPASDLCGRLMKHASSV
ncbi:MAG: hypothetical protein IPI67_30585 [Myxococcales bacterium]|nr:hypothetical protein [Myxococcales bacterium]